MKLIFELTQQEAQVVLNALVKEPFVTVADVVNKFQAQAQEQMQPKTQMEPVV